MCKVARLEAAGNQSVMTALTALRQSICKAMEVITAEVRVAAPPCSTWYGSFNTHVHLFAESLRPKRDS